MSERKRRRDALSPKLRRERRLATHRRYRKNHKAELREKLLCLRCNKTLGILGDSFSAVFDRSRELLAYLEGAPR